MVLPAHITTSWDDGHPMDLRLAELLEQYELPGTFYVPISNERPTLKGSQLRELSKRFEIGGHTLTHCDLTALPSGVARVEISDCRHAIEQITGRACTAFCFPRGRFRRQHLDDVRDSGFRTARTVELMSFDKPRTRSGVAVIPTTVQAWPTNPMEMARNATKRMRVGNLFRYLQFRKHDWVASAKALLSHVMTNGGVFHLWGHSWEIDEAGEWENVEEIFKTLSGCRGAARFLTNSELAAL
jgi:peptidoglycan-N-acetylglucosamine deacetylase